MTGAPLAPLERVRHEILSACRRLDAQVLPSARALGCVTAESVVARHDVPPFANTAMDGFAVRAADTADAPVELRVVGTIAAGAGPECEVGPGEAARIMTGAPMPPGADAVVMIERTHLSGEGPSARVTIEHAAAPGDFVRLPGSDLGTGQPVLEPGTVLGPAHLGLLASVGVSAVSVFPTARVGVLSTGDELVEGDGALGPGQIRDANRPVLLALLRQSGCTAIDLGMAPDVKAVIHERVAEALGECDALLVTGGVSVGDFDYVKAVIDELDQSWWWQVAVRPAKPLAFGVAHGAPGTPVFGLPGNPVSSMVSFELFARPALRRMMGFSDLLRPEVVAVADEPFARGPDGKLHLVRVVTSWDGDGRLHVRSAGGQASHMLSAMAAADGLALIPDGPGVDSGASVKVMLLT